MTVQLGCAYALELAVPITFAPCLPPSLQPAILPPAPPVGVAENYSAPSAPPSPYVEAAKYDSAMAKNAYDVPAYAG